MKLLSCIIVERLKDANFTNKSDSTKKNVKYRFKAFETDFDGARIPCELETFNDDVRDFLENQIADEMIYVPIILPDTSDKLRQFNGAIQYNVSKDILKTLNLNLVK